MAHFELKSFLKNYSTEFLELKKIRMTCFALP